MWSFIKFRQLVKSQETIVIRNYLKNLKIKVFFIFIAYQRASHNGGLSVGEDRGTAGHGERTPGDPTVETVERRRAPLMSRHCPPSTIYRGRNSLESRNKNKIFLSLI